MSKRWVVNVSGKTLGPWDQRGVRQALVDGHCSLTDKAKIDEDKKSQFVPLIDIEELFPAASFKKRLENSTQGSQEVLNLLSLSLKDKKKYQTPQNSEGKPRLDDLEKRYILIDNKSKKHGPYSIKNLKILASKGRLSPSFKVQNSSSQDIIALVDFLKAVDLKLGGSGKKKRRLSLLPLKARPIILVLLIIMVSGAGGFWLAQYWPGSELNSSRKNVETDTTMRAQQEGLVPRLEYRKIPATSTKSSPKEDASRQMAPKVKSSAEQVAARSGISKGKAQIKNKVLPLKKSQGKVLIATVREAKRFAGQSINLGPMKFDPKALKRCPAKCSLIMTDIQGAKIQVVFFKAAYAAKLNVKSSKVLISGRLDKNTSSLILSSVE